MGHGGFDAREGGTLLFTSPAGRGMPVTAADLGVLLRDHTSMRLAVLNACEAGRTDPEDPFAGVADTLVRRGIPAVIAMQFEVSDAAAVEFAPALYSALAAGQPVDTAMAEARKAIYSASPQRLEWATPVLYLRADDGLLFTLEPGTTPRNKATVPNGTEGYTEAEAAYREAIRLNPDYAEAHTGLGDALRAQKKYAEAAEAYQEAIRLNPDEATYHRNLGLALHSQEKYAEAAEAYQEAIRLNPDAARAHNGLGNALFDLSKYAEAEAAYREAIRLNPDEATYHRNLGLALHQQKR